jgi:hypothetical protein
MRMRFRFQILRSLAIAGTITAVLLIFTAGVLHAPAGSADAQSLCGAQHSSSAACAYDTYPRAPVAPARSGSPR